jgi:spermidine/putrescine transport system ATP-binding protein
LFFNLEQGVTVIAAARTWDANDPRQRNRRGGDSPPEWGMRTTRDNGTVGAAIRRPNMGCERPAATGTVGAAIRRPNQGVTAIDHRPMVELFRVNKFYGDNHVVKDLSLSVYEGEFLSILGSSGCGKTTTLRMIAGFEQQTDGVITIEGERMENKEPFERDVNTVFQSYALFPHMTVFDNVAYGLRIRKIKKREIAERVENALSMVRLQGYDKRNPAQLSGGQRQRVAIARAIVNNPKVLLLDEPLGALDMKLRKQMQLELKNLQKTLGITFIYVTHDQEEAMTMSDRIAVMSLGVLEQVGAPPDIYEHPETKFVADFIGETNLFEAVAERRLPDAVTRFAVETGSILGGAPDPFAMGEMFYISVRPEKTLFSPEPQEGFSLRGAVIENIYTGVSIRSIIQLSGGQQIKIVTAAGQPAPETGSLQYVYWRPDDAVLIKSPSRHIFDTIHGVNLSKYTEPAP